MFTVRLITDRHQRKALDEFLKRAQDVIRWAYDEQKQSLLAGVPMTLEELVAKVAGENDLHRETLEHACALGLDRLKAVLGGEISDRKSRNSRLFQIAGSSVMFSVFERKVGVPHIGLCSFKRNQFILLQVEGTEAKQLAMTPYRVELGYLYNDPVLMVDTIDRTPRPIPLPEQKLVKVVRKPKA